MFAPINTDRSSFGTRSTVSCSLLQLFDSTRSFLVASHIPYNKYHCLSSVGHIPENVCPGYLGIGDGYTTFPKLSCFLYCQAEHLCKFSTRNSTNWRGRKKPKAAQGETLPGPGYVIPSVFACDFPFKFANFDLKNCAGVCSFWSFSTAHLCQFSQHRPLMLKICRSFT